MLAPKGLPSFARLARPTAAVCLLFVLACHAPLQTPPSTPPAVLGAPPSQAAVVDILHGVEIADPYRWLEDQESPETRRWIGLQNTRTDTVLSRLEGQEALAARLAELLQVDTLRPPVSRGKRTFFARRGAEEDRFVIYLQEGKEGKPERLLDPHPESPDNSVSFQLSDVSDDGSLLIYRVREGGEDQVSVRFFDVDQRRHLADELPRAYYSSVDLSPDQKTVYYVRHEGTIGPRLFAHEMGTPLERDREVFGAGYGPDVILVAQLSDDGRYLLANALYGSAADRTEVYIQDLREGTPFRAVVNDIDGRFLGSVVGGRLLLQTTWQAPNGRLLSADPARPEREHWREIVAEQPEAVLRKVTVAGGKLFLDYLRDVKVRVFAYDLDGRRSGEITFDTVGSIGGLRGDWKSPDLFVTFNSFHRPETIYRYDVASGELEVWAEPQVPFDPEPYTVEQVWFTSKDGTRVPMFLTYAKDLERHGANPTLLTGYGGFNVSRTPRFSAHTAAWIERGGVYAVANLRGGGEFGEAWHQAGMREQKQNVFDDFIAAAEWLIEEGYTRPDRLAIRGGSNGGLLVSAVSNQRPELFGAVICSYPLLDMLRFHLFLKGPYWVPEYGSADDPELFEALRAYSPYHNIREGVDYPATLFITGDGDTRVAPLHARKMAALLQDLNGSDNPILLRYHIKAGHSGSEPVSERIQNMSESLSFLFWQLGVEGAG